MFSGFALLWRAYVSGFRVKGLGFRVCGGDVEYCHRLWDVQVTFAHREAPYVCQVGSAHPVMSAWTPNPAP